MLELKLIQEYPQQIIATDEVGRGPLGGPVVVGAICFSIQNSDSLKQIIKYFKSKGITDSKKLSIAERGMILKKLGISNCDFREKKTLEIKGTHVSCVTWDMDHEVIDQENILAASLRGMKEAAQFLSDEKKEATTVLIDGHMKLRWGKELSPWNEIPIIKGDSKSVLIGLASIIAKEKRDAFMREMHELYPQYGFASNFGYPTKEHRSAIEEHGPCPIHRKTFKGVKEFISATF
ncbi:MAG: ribonuclease HII [Bacteriovoracaceae bacterium]